jgi:hypothetical protein
MSTGEARWTKAEALAALESAYQDVLLAVAGYLHEDFEARRIDGDRSPKDVLAHIALWNWQVPPAVKRILADEVPFWVPIDLDDLNEAAFLERRDWPQARVMDNLASSHLVLMSALGRATDEEFSRPMTHQPEEDILGGLMWLASGYVDHYKEHQAQLPEPNKAHPSGFF